ncbi:SRPBCC family protein [Aquirufa sp. ROCK2-A2]
MEKLTTIQREIQINQPLEKVWAALADFGNICHGHPGVHKSYVTSLQNSGVGATRHCDFTMMGASAEERIIEWNTLENIKIEVYQLKKMPGIDKLSLDLAIHANEENTILKSTMVYSMKNVFFDLMNKLMMKKMNAELLDGIMAGHKLYIETGTIVTEKTKLNVNEVIKIN